MFWIIISFLISNFRNLEKFGNEILKASPFDSLKEEQQKHFQFPLGYKCSVNVAKPLFVSRQRMSCVETALPGGAGSEVWNRVYMIAPVKKFGRVRLSTNFPSKQIWRRMRTWKDDEFFLSFTFYGVQTSRKGFHELFSWTFWTSGGVMYEQFMSDFAHRDSTPWQVQLFISLVNFRATSLRAACSISYIFFHLRWY